MSKQAVLKISETDERALISSYLVVIAILPNKIVFTDFRNIKESRKSNLMLLVVLPSSGKSTLCHHTVHYENSTPHPGPSKKNAK